MAAPAGTDTEPRPSGGVSNYEPRSDERRPWWRKLDLYGPDGTTFLRRRGFDLRRFGGLLVHRIDAPDPGLDLHDHPWWFATLVLRGGYTDQSALITQDADRGLILFRTRKWRRWSLHRMPLDVAHRIVRVEPGTVTLVLRGPKVRVWGFFMPPSEGGWVPWDRYDYVARRPGSCVSSHPEENHP